MKFDGLHVQASVLEVELTRHKSVADDQCNLLVPPLKVSL